MIGNDVIDLQQAVTESNWQRKGWLSKLFSINEIEWIENSKYPEIAVWLYWSMKEAAYKIYNRISGETTFAPLKFGCRLTMQHTHFASGYVLFEEKKYYTKSSITKEYIHSIATVDPNLPIHILMNKTSQIVELPPHFSLLKSDAHLPYLLNNNTGVTFIASKSHHGKYEAIVY